MSESILIEHVARAIDPRPFSDDWREHFLFASWRDQAGSKAIKQAKQAIKVMKAYNEFRSDWDAALSEQGRET